MVDGQRRVRHLQRSVIIVERLVCHRGRRRCQHLDLLQAFTRVDDLVAYLFQACRECHSPQVVTIVEGLVPDAGHFLWNDERGQAHTVVNSFFT